MNDLEGVSQVREPTQIAESRIQSFVDQLQQSRPLDRSERWMMFGGTVALAAVLATATWLTPSPNGFGTHKQLGLPDCTSISVFKMRCPGCGMTTSWANVMHGNFSMALQANRGGTVLCLLAIFCVPVMGYLAIRGRTSRYGWFSRAALSGLLAAFAIAIVEWVIRLALP